MAAGMMFVQAPAAPAKSRAGKTMARQALKGRMFRALNLTEAQKQEIKTSNQRAKQNAQPLAKQLKTNREALAAAVKANDVAQIHSLSAQQGHLQGQLLALRSEARAKVFATLTPDQRARAEQMRQKVRERMEQRIGKRKADKA